MSKQDPTDPHADFFLDLSSARSQAIPEKQALSSALASLVDALVSEKVVSPPDEGVFSYGSFSAEWHGAGGICRLRQEGTEIVLSFLRDGGLIVRRHHLSDSASARAMARELVSFARRAVR